MTRTLARSRPKCWFDPLIRYKCPRSCAYVTLTDPTFDFETMVARVRASGLAAFKIPERLEVRGELPRTPTGKIRKDVLRAEIAALVAGVDT